MRIRLTVTVLAAAAISLAISASASAAQYLVNFDDVPNLTVISNQYSPAIFSSTAGFVPLTFGDPTIAHSGPNFLCPNTVPLTNCQHDLIVRFTTPVQMLRFYAVGVSNVGPVATIDVTTQKSGVLHYTVVGDGHTFTPILQDLSAINGGITNIRVHDDTDPNGIGWDDFSFSTGATTTPKPTPPPKPPKH
jgi:hypothetical protein